MSNVTPGQMSGGRDQLLAAGSKISYRDIYNMEIGIPLHKKMYYKAEDVDALFVIINGVFMDVSSQAHRNQKVLSEARKNLQTVETELAEKSRLLDKVQQQNQKMEDHLSSLITKMTSQGAEKETEAVKDLEKKLVQLESKNNLLEAERRKLEAEQETVKADVDVLVLQLKEKEDSYSRLIESSAAKMDELQAEIDRLEDAVRIQGELDHVSQEVSQLRYELDGKDAQLANLENDNDILRSKTQELNRVLDEKQDELELLEYRFKKLQELNKGK